MAAGAPADGANFDATLGATPPPSKPLASSVGTGSTLWPAGASVQPRAASPYQKFEAVMLQNFVQNILPKDQNLFGDAASADIVRTMMAEQLANQLAKSGRVGIARMIEAAHPGSKGKPSGVHFDPALVEPKAPLDLTPHALNVAPLLPPAPTIE